jgi:hypothetical protein
MGCTSRVYNYQKYFGKLKRETCRILVFYFKPQPKANLDQLNGGLIRGGYQVD